VHLHFGHRVTEQLQEYVDVKPLRPQIMLDIFAIRSTSSNKHMIAQR
jgi:hypothetical protein